LHYVAICISGLNAAMAAARLFRIKLTHGEIRDMICLEQHICTYKLFGLLSHQQKTEAAQIYVRLPFKFHSFLQQRIYFLICFMIVRLLPSASLTA